jgi:tetratricopeptide (TPR) repeat protein
MGKAAGRESPAREAEQLWGKLAGQHPAVTEFQNLWAEALTKRALEYVAAKEPAEAMKACEAAVNIRRKLAEVYPDIPRYRGDWARSYFQLAEIHRALKQHGDYWLALAIQAKLVKEVPEVPQYQADLARSWHGEGLLEISEAALCKALAAWEKLVAAYPKELEFALGLERTAVSLGRLAQNQKKYDDTLIWYTRAIDTLKAVAPADVRPSAVRLNLCDAYSKRADALMQQARYAEALPDWDQAFALGAHPARLQFKFFRAIALAHLGEHDKATKEAAELTAVASGSGQALYHLACVYALSAAAAGGDTTLAAADRKARSDQYAAQAVTMLTKAQAAGFFKSPAAREQLSRDPSLDSLRNREAFMSLLGTLTETKRGAV